MKLSMAGMMGLACALAGMAAPGGGTSGTHGLTEVFHDNEFQFTGVSISKTGRLFVNYPRWSDHYQNAVVEVSKDGSAKPFPDESWNRWDNQIPTAGKHFVCVQSIVVDDQDALWILDPAAPLLGTVVPGGAKLVKVDLKTNQVTKVILFGPDVAKPNSYLNDIRFDNKRGVGYITDSGAPGIVVVDLNSGKAHRALDGHPSTKADPNQQIVIDGKPVLGPTGKPPTFNSDGIAISPDKEWLYYQALTAATLYRVKTSVLRDPNASAATVGSAVEKVATTFPTDGLWMDPQGRLYLTGLQQKAVMRRLPNGTMETVVSDPRFEWPDTFTQGADGALYVTTSHINESPQYNKGKSVRKLPYTVFKLQP